MNAVKYPRTFHLPWSEGRTSDDKVLLSDSFFEGKEVVVTEKMDGENTSMYRDHIHARSLDSRHHPSRDWVKRFWGRVQREIPYGWRICGENLYAKHAIHYQDLESYFYGFSIWAGDLCFAWDDTVEYFELFGVTCVPVLYQGPYDRDVIMDIWSKMDQEAHEGYVIRTADGFALDEFTQCVAKNVRKGHVEQGSDHWMHQKIVPNNLKQSG